MWKRKKDKNWEVERAVGREKRRKVWKKKKKGRRLGKMGRSRGQLDEKEKNVEEEERMKTRKMGGEGSWKRKKRKCGRGRKECQWGRWGGESS